MLFTSTWLLALLQGCWVARQSPPDIDTTTDSGCPRIAYYFDDDEDGFGDPSNTESFCQSEEVPSSPWVGNAEDCNDQDSRVPGPVELCDGIDNDSKGRTDDVFAASVGSSTFQTIESAIAFSAKTDDSPVVNLCVTDDALGYPLETIELLGGEELTLVGSTGRSNTVLRSATGKSLFSLSTAASLTLRSLSVVGARDEPAVQSDQPSALTLDDVRMFENLNGAIRATGGPFVLRIEESLIDNNEALEGGGVYLNGLFDAQLVDSLVDSKRAVFLEGQTSTGRGGGLYALAGGVNQGRLTLEGVTISANESGQSGGGMYLRANQAGDLVVELRDGTLVTGNLAVINGGGALVQTAADSEQPIVITGVGAPSSFESNDVSSDGGGGGITFNTGRGEFSGFVIRGNTARLGAGIRVPFTANLTLSGMDIIGNTARNDGGALWMRWSTVDVRDGSRVHQNSGSTGVFLYGNDVDPLARLVSRDCHWGDSGSPLDNLPVDVMVFDQNSVLQTFDYAEGPVDLVCSGDSTPACV